MESWSSRIERARELAGEDGAAAQVLLFYAQLADYQQELAEAVPPAGVGHTDPANTTWSDAIDYESALMAIPGLLELLRRSGPAPLARVAGEAAELARERWRGLLHDIATSPENERDAEGLDVMGPTVDSSSDASMSVDSSVASFVVEAVLQPLAERAALPLRSRVPQVASTAEPFPARCPVCSGLPVVGTLRPEGQGARRALVCGRCLTEWPFRRVLCAWCAEQRFDQLPVYGTETLPHVRVEACNNCRHYIKTVDLTRNGLAVPIVDDLASVPLDLWARGQGYRRVRHNLLRL
jgi:formate dehydrogenase accessory protein FdhE